MGGGEPVSRFWACFFSPGIFALLWTTKMRVTRKWLLAIAGPWAMPIVVAALVDEYKPAGLLDEVATAAMVIGAFGIPVFATAVPFMFKWATEYNTGRFGHASKRRWKKAREESHRNDTGGGGKQEATPAMQFYECPECHSHDISNRPGGGMSCDKCGFSK